MAKLIHCKSCGKEVASSARECPYCGQKLKLGFFSKLMLGIGGFLFLLLLYWGLFR